MYTGMNREKRIYGEKENCVDSVNMVRFPTYRKKVAKKI